MSFEADLKAHLQAAATIAGVVADRITPLIRQERAAPPALVYTVISTEDNGNLAGSAGGATGGLDRFRVQIDGYAETHAVMIALRLAVRARMTSAASSFRAVLLPGGGEQYEQDTKLYRFLLEFSVWYSPT
jgi:hypothetical protein